MLRAGLLALWLVAAVAMAAPADYGCNRVLRVGLIPFGLLYYRDADNAMQGFEVDLVNEIQRRTACRLASTELTRVLSLKMLQSGQIDISTSMALVPERADQLWMIPLLASRNDMLLNKRQLGFATRPAQLLATPGSYLAVVPGAVYGEPYDQLIRELAAQRRVVQVPDQPAGFRQLQQGRVQAVIGHPFLYRHLLTSKQLRDEYVVRHWAGHAAPLPGGWGFARQHFLPAQIDRWRSLFDELRRDGTIERLLARHMDQEAARGLVYQP